MRINGVLVVIGLAALSACNRDPKLTDATAGAATPAPVQASLPLSSSLKDASAKPADAIAKVEAERLEKTVVDSFAPNDANNLAAVCLQARVACGFELRGDVWNRPEAKARLSGVSAALALASFLGKDYKMTWVGPVMHVFPAETDGLLPLDTVVVADASPDSPSADPETTFREIAAKLDLEMPAAPERPKKTNLVGSSTMPVKASARAVLDLWCRPAMLKPSTYVATYGPGRAGSLRWYWGVEPAQR